MHDEHLDPDALARLLSEENLEDRNRLLLHLLSLCFECYETGGYLLELYRSGTLPLAFGPTDVALAKTRAEAPRLLEEIVSRPFEVQLGFIQSDRRFLSWGLCELLCPGERAGRSLQSSSATSRPSSNEPVTILVLALSAGRLCLPIVPAPRPIESPSRLPE